MFDKHLRSFLGMGERQTALVSRTASPPYNDWEARVQQKLNSTHFTRDFPHGTEVGQLKRYTWHQNRYGAVVRFPLPHGRHYHGFYAVLDGEVVHMGEAPPPPASHYRQSAKVTQTVTMTRTFRR